MGAFQSGFQMGQQGYQDAQDRTMRQRDLEMREAAAAQESQIRGLQIKAGTRAENQAQRSQDASTTYAGLVTSGTQTGNTSGMSDDSARMLYTGAGGGAKGQQAVDDMASISNAENVRFGLGAKQYQTSSTVAPDGQAATGLAPTVTTKAASPAELARARANMFAIQQDWKGHEQALGEVRKYDYDEGFAKHSADWNSMPDAAKTELIHKLSDDTGVRGYGTWVPGKGKQAGYMNYMAPGADPVKLSNTEAGQLYALTNLMQVDPGRARAEMDSVSDKVRLVAQSAFEAQTKGVTANNTATHDAAMDRSSLISANAAATSAGSIAAMRKEQIKDLDDQRTRRTGLEQIQSDVDALDPKDPQFAQKMRQLQARANLANVKNGAPLNFGRDFSGGSGAGRKSILQMPVDQKVNPDGSYTAFAKDGGGPLYNTWHGETMPLGMEVDDLKKLKGDAAKARVQMQLGENNGKLEYRFIGADGNPYATVDEAGRAKPASSKSPAASPAPDAPRQGLSIQRPQAPVPPALAAIQAQRAQEQAAYEARQAQAVEEQRARMGGFNPYAPTRVGN